MTMTMSVALVQFMFQHCVQCTEEARAVAIGNKARLNMTMSVALSNLAAAAAAGCCWLLL